MCKVLRRVSCTSFASVLLSVHCSGWLQLVARGGRCVTVPGVLQMFVVWTNLVDFRLAWKQLFREEGGPPNILGISPRVIHHKLNFHTTSDASGESILLSSNEVIELRLERTTFTPQSPLTRGSPCYRNGYCQRMVLKVCERLLAASAQTADGSGKYTRG